MARAHDMDLFDAVTTIGEKIASLAPSTTWATNKNGEVQASFPYPDMLLPFPGKPSLAVALDDEADDGEGLEGVLVPRFLIFEAMVYHPLFGASGLTTSGYEQAQMNCLRGDSELQKALRQNPELDGLILELGIEAVEIGPFNDPDDNIHYGHRILIVTQLH